MSSAATGCPPCAKRPEWTRPKRPAAECTFIRTTQDWQDYTAGARFPGHPLNGLTFQQLADFEASRHGHAWPQIAGEEGERLFRLYRVTEVPTYCVVDEEATIRARGHTHEWAEILGVLGRLSHPVDGLSPEPRPDPR